jgi:alpha-D-xyloside xylohydrolase
MKFTHGVWFDREHTQIYNAVEVDSVTSPTSEPGSIRALCTTKHVAHRGDTLNHPTITLKLSSPAPDVVAGTVWHFSGARDDEPRFELFPDGSRDAEARSAIEVQHDDRAGVSSLRSGGLKAVLNRNARKFRIGFESVASGAAGTEAEGSSASRQLTDLGYASVQYMVAPPSHPTPSPPVATTLADSYYRAPPTNSKQPYISLSFGLEPGEHVYGLGERFGPFVKNGQEIDLWNEDGGTSTPYSKPSLLSLSSKGVTHLLTSGSV